MLQIKKRGLSSRLNIFTYANFGFAETGTACGISPSLYLYRNSIGQNFVAATLLAEDEDFTILADAGYYSEFDITQGEIVSRYWSGTAFVGDPDLCG
jgi:hypothetical protein